MDLGLNGKRAVITGGSRGIGFAIAEALAAEGVAVGLVARSADGLAAAAERLDGRGVPVATVAINGAANAALFAAAILALNDPALYERLAAWRAARAQEVLEQKLPD